MAGKGRGFTLIELAVVMLIIAILAALAVPVFLRQREKGWVAQTQSALAAGRIAAESYFVDDSQGNGSYAGLNGNPGALAAEGMRHAASVTVLVRATSSRYCIFAVHFDLGTDHEWGVATLDSRLGEPTPADDCL